MNKIDFAFPDSWQDLSEKQLAFVFRLLADNIPMEQLKIFCLFRWNNVSVLANKGDGTYILGLRKRDKTRKNQQIFSVSPLQIAEILPSLSWLDSIPDFPIRIERIGWHKALPADFQEVPFEKFIMAENLYQGYLEAMRESGGAGSKQAEELLDQLGSVLYDKARFKPWQKVNCFYWFTSLKNLFSRLFPDFFRPSGGADNVDNGPSTALDGMNAMIRALTKGDVTKEKEILKLDTWRALTELNAQAKEYREFNAKYNKK